MNKALALLAFVSVLSQNSFAEWGFNYSSHEYKVWLWSDSLQIQITEPSTKSSGIFFAKYIEGKNLITEFELDWVSKGGEEPHPSISALTELSHLLAALNGIELSNLVSLNLYSTRDFEYDKETHKSYFPVFLPLEDGEKVRTERLSPEEADFYRLNRLIQHISNLAFKEFLIKGKVDAKVNRSISSQAMSCYDYL